MNKLPFAFPLADDDILRRRATILTALCAADNGFCAVPVQSIRRQTLSQMLNLYDKLFFGGFLSHSYGQIDVTLSQRLISSAGKFIYTRGGVSRMYRAEIRMSGDFLFRLNKGPFLLNGLSVSTAQEAFLVVFEHELCHAAGKCPLWFNGTFSAVPFSCAWFVRPYRYPPQPPYAAAGCSERRAFRGRQGLLLLSGQHFKRCRYLCGKNGNGYGGGSPWHLSRSDRKTLRQIPRPFRAADRQVESIR